MTTNHHTPLPTLIDTTAEIEGPLGELDEQLTTVTNDLAGQLGGANVSNQVLKEWTESEAYKLANRVYDSTYTNVLSTATVTWPDGSGGTYTTTSINTTWRAVDAYTITHLSSGKTVTQSAATRNVNGNLTGAPVLTIS